MKLFFAECGKLVKSPVYWIAVILLFVFIWSQAASAFDTVQQPPDPGSGNYGMEAKDAPAHIMPKAVEALYSDFMENSYVAYPIGFYKHIKLNWDKKLEMAGVLSELTGLSRNELIGGMGKDQDTDGSGAAESPINDANGGEAVISVGEGREAQLTSDGAGGYTISAPERGAQAGIKPTGSVSAETIGGYASDAAADETDGAAGNADSAAGSADGTAAADASAGTVAGAAGENTTVSIRNGLSYEQFKKLMNRADEILGGGSDYGELFRVSRFGMLPLTYEEAVERYDRFVNQDKVTGAYARLISDYLTIICGLLPVFVTVAQSLADRRARMQELIWSRTASAGHLTAARYSSVVIMFLLPLMAVAAWATWETYSLYGSSGLELSPTAFFLCISGWVMPTVMLSAAVGTFLTELTETPLAVAAMGLWWFMDINAGLRQMDGGYAGLPLIPRHNSLIGADTFAQNFTTLAADRLLYAAAALVLTAAAAAILERKRKGKGYGAIRYICTVRPFSRKKPAV